MNIGEKIVDKFKKIESNNILKEQYITRSKILKTLEQSPIYSPGKRFQQTREGRDRLQPYKQHQWQTYK